MNIAYRGSDLSFLASDAGNWLTALLTLLNETSLAAERLSDGFAIDEHLAFNHTSGLATGDNVHESSLAST